MSMMLRICLIAASVLTMIVMMHKIRKSKVQIEDSIFWVLFSMVLILFSVFPQVAYLLSDLVGTDAPSNFIFMLVIFLLLMKIFSMTVRLSQLETRLQELVQRIALEEMESGRRKSSGGKAGAEGKTGSGEKTDSQGKPDSGKERNSKERYDDAENNQS